MTHYCAISPTPACVILIFPHQQPEARPASASYLSLSLSFPPYYATLKEL